VQRCQNPYIDLVRVIGLSSKAIIMFPGKPSIENVGLTGGAYDIPYSTMCMSTGIEAQVVPLLAAGRWMQRSQLRFSHGEYVGDAVNAGPVFLLFQDRQYSAVDPGQ
jgi:hypothetical protein